VRRLIQELARERTVLFSSHILPEIEAVCPRVILLHKGRIAADGQQEELVRRLGGESHVRVELARAPDAAAARAALAALPGVQAVEQRAPLEGWHVFDLAAEDDVRAAVGELARAQGWTLRELSWQRPTLERLFARVALELDPVRPAASA
jgi:ABC-2 type transport system ATP-binding protein